MKLARFASNRKNFRSVHANSDVTEDAIGKKWLECDMHFWTRGSKIAVA
jgi:hypothetical protein